MKALTEKQRGYVLAMLSNPLGNPTQWARAAGYSDHMSRAKVSGHFLSHDPKIAEAVKEVAQAAAHTMGPLLGLAVAMQIAKDKDHPQRLRAAVALMDRGGLPAASEQTVKVHHTDHTGAAMVERIRQLAAFLDIPADRLLGGNAAPVLIEASVSHETGEVKDG